MSPMRMIILAVAAVAAIGLAFLVRGIAGGGKAAPQTVVQTVEKPTAKVLVASRDLPVGARLTRDDFAWQSWPLESVNAAYITDGSVELPKPEPVVAEGEEAEDAEKAKKKAKKDKDGEEEVAEPTEAERMMASAKALMEGGGPMEALAGAVVREAVMKGDPITERKLVRAGDSGFLAVVLAPGMRAMSIPVSVESAAGGFILPGDRVDVLLSRQAPQGSAGGNEFRTDTVMRNVKVLAIDQVTKPENGAQSVVGATATLEVGSMDAEALAQADAQGDVALVLRSYADVGGPSGATARPQLARDAGSVRVWREGAATTIAVQ